MRLFNDSKTFVDMSLKQSPGSDTKRSFCFVLKKNFQQPKYKLVCPSISEEVLSAFNNLSKPISEAQGRKFVGDHFSGPGDEFQPWKPTDLPRMYVFIKSCACLFLINCNSKCFVINRKSCKYTNFVIVLHNISRYTCISTQCKVMIICGIIRRSTCHCAGLPSWIISRIPYWGALPGTSVGLGKTWVEKWVLFPELIRDNPRINLLNMIFLTIFFHWSVTISPSVSVGCTAQSLVLWSRFRSNLMWNWIQIAIPWCIYLTHSLSPGEDLEKPITGILRFIYQ